MRPFYQYPYDDESGNNKNYSTNISTTTTAHAVTMESIEKKFHKIFQDKNSKSNIINSIKHPLIVQGHNVNGLPITYF